MNPVSEHQSSKHDVLKTDAMPSKIFKDIIFSTFEYLILKFLFYILIIMKEGEVRLKTIKGLVSKNFLSHFIKLKNAFCFLSVYNMKRLLLVFTIFNIFIFKIGFCQNTNSSFSYAEKYFYIVSVNLKTDFNKKYQKIAQKILNDYDVKKGELIDENALLNVLNKISMELQDNEIYLFSILYSFDLVKTIKDIKTVDIRISIKKVDQIIINNMFIDNYNSTSEKINYINNLQKGGIFKSNDEIISLKRKLLKSGNLKSAKIYFYTIDNSEKRDAKIILISAEYQNIILFGFFNMFKEGYNLSFDLHMLNLWKKLYRLNMNLLLPISGQPADLGFNLSFTMPNLFNNKLFLSANLFNEIGRKYLCKDFFLFRNYYGYSISAGYVGINFLNFIIKYEEKNNKNIDGIEGYERNEIVGKMSIKTIEYILLFSSAIPNWNPQKGSRIYLSYISTFKSDLNFSIWKINYEKYLSLLKRLIIGLHHKEYILLSSNPKINFSLFGFDRRNMFDHYDTNDSYVERKFIFINEIEMRFRIIYELLDFVLYFDANEYCKNYQYLNSNNLIYQVGAGFRISPNYFIGKSFTCPLPVSIYVGKYLKNSEVDFSLKSHNDYFYIDMTSSF